LNYREQLEILIADKKGLVITNEVEKKGIPRPLFNIICERGEA
jgi:hypothetical protein